ncbi:ArsI/CadI family heavy metal resistance metalloenzyme [Candidatus Entotheonella palauensis]|uniref:ArsI/CadI family heavy metal resistance metalloenzyme n=1 Tax=Candidatus Entotheonella palauensis TaxID=93172 RepID=UPI000B7FED2B|nr:ArsI/CadI family heavy metal resistance metalloenzyme [Candidatus Entotheonella palauensis]
MRLQLALNVRNIEEAVDYYTKLFGVQPHKERPGYANFAIEQPPLKLILFENPNAAERINHLGVEVFGAGDVEAAFQRLEPEGLVEKVEHGETCCYATQDKVWSREPQGLSWEWYRITDDDPAAAALTPAITGCACADTPGEVCCS